MVPETDPDEEGDAETELVVLIVGNAVVLAGAEVVSGSGGAVTGGGTSDGPLS